MEKQEYFEYKEKGKPIYFLRTKEDQFICWKCGNKYKSIVRHITFKESCRGSIDIDNFKKNFREFRIDKSKKANNSRVKKCTELKRIKLGDQFVKDDQNKRQTKFINKKRVESGPLQLRKEVNERRSKWRKRKMEEVPEQLITEENKRKRLSLKRQKVKNHEEVKENQNKRKSKSRLVY